MKKCLTCVHRRDVPGSAHSRCNNVSAIVKGDEHGIKKGWFTWPLDFDPVWLISCDGYSDNKEDDMPKATTLASFNAFTRMKAVSG